MFPFPSRAGSIPRELGKMHGLKNVLLYRNNLDGELLICHGPNRPTEAGLCVLDIGI